MSSHQVKLLSYGCECGKEFSGETKRVEMLLRLHYKKCKCSKSESSTIGGGIHIGNSRRNRNGSLAKIITGDNGDNFIEHSRELSTRKSIIGSS
jgi:hypothetical protein